MDLKKPALTIILLMVIAIFSGCATTTKSQTKGLTKMKIGYMDIGDCLQLFVALDKGFLEEEGIDPQLTVMAGGTPVTNAVDSGELETGWIGVTPTIVHHSRGSDLKLIAPGAFIDFSKDIYVHKLLVSSGSDINEPKDLEGKTVAVNEEVDIDRINLDAWAEKNNVNISRINVVPVPFPQMESALESGEIDAAIFIEPFVTLSISSGVARVLDDRVFSSVTDKWMMATWIAKDSWIKSNPEKARGFLNAINKANKYIMENPDEMPQILTKYTRLTEDLISQISMPAFKEKITREEIQPMIDATYKYGYSEKTFDAKEIVMEGLLSS